MSVRSAMSYLTACALVLLGGVGCGAATSPTAEAPTQTRELTVFAAASLAGAFDEIGAAFSATRPGTAVRFSYAGSSDLVSQLAAGAPADVLATADERTMRQATNQGLVGQPTVFATNELAILVAPGNPLGIVGARDLTHPALSLVVCAPQVPCGAAAERALTATGITTRPVSQEPSATAAASKVSSGQADAAVVYATDVARAQAAGTGMGIPLGIDQVPNRYPIAVTTGPRTSDARDRDRAGLAEDFLAYVRGREAQAMLERAGFGSP